MNPPLSSGARDPIQQMTLDDLLMLTGRLDDESGFDTARERFRRFLVERVTDVGPLRALLDQCQHSASEQHRRALQDLVALLGKSLGFSTRFASYAARSGEGKADGVWHSVRGVDFSLALSSEPAQLSRINASPAAPSPAANGRSLRLHILTPACEARAQIDGILKAVHPESPSRVITLRSLLSMAQLVRTGRLNHDDVVRLFESGSDLEFVVELLERTPRAGTEMAAPPAGAPRAARTDPIYWVATLAADQGLTPEQILVDEVGQRHELDVTETGDSDPTPQPGDGICFHLPGMGIVGFCEVRFAAERRASPDEEGRYRRQLQLERLVLHRNAPRPLGYEIQLRLRVEGRRKAKGHWLARISREEFMRVTAGTNPDRRAAAAAPQAAANERDRPVSVSAADSPTPG